MAISTFFLLFILAIVILSYKKNITHTSWKSKRRRHLPFVSLSAVLRPTGTECIELPWLQTSVGCPTLCTLHHKNIGAHANHIIIIIIMLLFRRSSIALSFYFLFSCGNTFSQFVQLLLLLLFSRIKNKLSIAIMPLDSCSRGI